MLLFWRFIDKTPLSIDCSRFHAVRNLYLASSFFSFFLYFFVEVLFTRRIRRFDLRLTSRGYFRGYDSRIDATISNAAASAGLFFVAALTPKTLDLVDTRSTAKSGERSLLSAFYAPQELYEAGAIDRLIAGATGQFASSQSFIDFAIIRKKIEKRICELNMQI